MLSEKTKYFIRDYRLPLRATTVFLVILLSLFFVRTYERSVLSDILQGDNGKNHDYAKLLSSDKVASLQKHDVNEQTDPAVTKSKTGGSSASSTTATGASASSGSTTSSGSTGTGSGGSSGSSGTGTTTPPPTSGGGSTTPPPTTAPFTAQVLRVYKDNMPNGFSCSGTTSGSTSCVVTINFRADVNTNNGPGNVQYMWHWAGGQNGGSSSSGNFSAAAGSTISSLQQKVSLTCSPGQVIPLTVSLGITSPTPNGSSASFPVNCGP